MTIKNINISVNGRWSQWGKFTVCTKTCGGGMRMRVRRCNNPAPRNGGKNCPGENGKRKVDIQECRTNACRKYKVKFFKRTYL